MIGGVCGAYLLSNIDAGVVKPFVLIYLTAIGIYLLVQGLLLRPSSARRSMSRRSVSQEGSSTRRAAVAGGRW